MGNVSLTPIFWVAVAILCGGCAAPAEPEAQVREVIRQAEQAAEARDLRKMRTLVADAYLDVRGNDKPALENLLRLVFLAHQSVHLVIYVESIEFPSAAVAEVVALVGMADTAAALPDVDLYQFEVQLASQGDGEWQLVDADWRRGLGKAPGE